MVAIRRQSPLERTYGHVLALLDRHRLCRPQALLLRGVFVVFAVIYVHLLQKELDLMETPETDDYVQLLRNREHRHHATYENVTEEELTPWRAAQSPVSPPDWAEHLPTWMTAYVEKHGQILEARQPKYFRWLCRENGRCGGVGDRLAGIVQSFYTAMCLDRAFLLDWSVPDSLLGYLEPNLVRWNAKPRRVSMAALVTAMNDQNVDPNSFPVQDSLVEIQTNVWHEDFFQSTCMQDYLQRVHAGTTETPTPAELYRLAFWTLFRWRPAVVEHVARLRHHMTLQSPYVGVHIRTGRAHHADGAFHASDETTWDVYHQCARNVQAELRRRCQKTPAEVPMYLATDLHDAKVKLSEEDESVKSVDMEVFHIDKTSAALLYDATTAELDVWSDIKLLADSTCLVMSESRFSRLGQYLPMQPRCAVFWNDCGPDKVAKAIEAVSDDGCQ